MYFHPHASAQSSFWNLSFQMVLLVSSVCAYMCVCGVYISISEKMLFCTLCITSIFWIYLYSSPLFNSSRVFHCKKRLDSFFPNLWFNRSFTSLGICLSSHLMCHLLGPASENCTNGKAVKSLEGQWWAPYGREWGRVSVFCPGHTGVHRKFFLLTLPNGSSVCLR